MCGDILFVLPCHSHNIIITHTYRSCNYRCQKEAHLQCKYLRSSCSLSHIIVRSVVRDNMLKVVRVMGKWLLPTQYNESLNRSQKCSQIAAICMTLPKFLYLPKLHKRAASLGKFCSTFLYTSRCTFLNTAVRVRLII